MTDAGETLDQAVRDLHSTHRLVIDLKTRSDGTVDWTACLLGENFLDGNWEVVARDVSSKSIKRLLGKDLLAKLKTTPKHYPHREKE